MRLSRAACCTWKDLVEDGSKMDLSVVWHTGIPISAGRPSKVVETQNNQSRARERQRLACQAQILRPSWIVSLFLLFAAELVFMICFDAYVQFGYVPNLGAQWFSLLRSCSPQSRHSAEVDFNMGCVFPKWGSPKVVGLPC